MHGGCQAGPVKGKAQGWMKIIATGLYGKKGVFFAMIWVWKARGTGIPVLSVRLSVTLETGF